MLGIRNYPHCTRLLENARFTAIRSMNDLLKNTQNKKQSLRGNFATYAICFRERSSNGFFLKRKLPATDRNNALSQRRYLFHALFPIIKSSLTSRGLAYGSSETKIFRFFITDNQSFKAATVFFHQKSTLVTPRKPAEPEYCCMGGCAECVWDIYAKELKAWHDHTNKLTIDNRPYEHADNMSFENTTESQRGEKKMREQNLENDLVTEKNGTRNSIPSILVEKRVDGDTSQREDNDGMSHLPVEIREFMKLEKRLKGGK